MWNFVNTVMEVLAPIRGYQTRNGIKSTADIQLRMYVEMIIRNVDDERKYTYCEEAIMSISRYTRHLLEALKWTSKKIIIIITV
jgi:hypothetical protein